LSVGIAAGLSPGPLLALVISQTLRYGRREGLRVAVAPLISDVPVVLSCLFVLARVSVLGPVLAWVSILGGVFVAYLGFESFRASGIDLSAQSTQPRSLTKAVLLNLLNPHVYLFWATVGGPMLLKGLGRHDSSALAFTGGFYACLVGSKVLLAVLVSRSRNVVTGRGYRFAIRVLGVLLFGVAVWMLAGGIVSLSAPAGLRGK